jgi:enoyl-CoA hydratase
MTESLILLDRPRPHVARITLNRPEARNALRNDLRGEIFSALEAHDRDPDIRVTIIRGDERAFSAGYDLNADLLEGQPYHSAGGLGAWPRHVVEGSFRIWDLAKPVIAQVSGYCLAGGMELAQSCDLVYVAEDAKIGYPPVRSVSPPDNQFFPWVMGMRRAMELMLTGDSITGRQAVEYGFANACFPGETLEAEVLSRAERVAKIPSDLQQINKRSVHRQMELMGIRSAIRAGTELQALALNTETTRTWLASLAEKGLTKALDARDGSFADYRTIPKPG